jgi:hypothetical protein
LGVSLTYFTIHILINLFFSSGGGDGGWGGGGYEYQGEGDWGRGGGRVGGRRGRNRHHPYSRRGGYGYRPY